MKKVLVVLASLSLVVGAAFADSAKKSNELNPAAHDPNAPAGVGDDEGNNDQGDGDVSNRAVAAGSGQLVNHGGGVMAFAKVVCIFWGPSLSSSSSYVTELRSFRNSISGMVSHTAMLNQYGANQNNFIGSQADQFDTTNPSSAAVTDAMVQSEVAKYFGGGKNGGYNTNTVYEVFIPSGYYSKDGTSTSCGGPSLAYCAYHSNGNGTNLPTNVKYSIEPYPSCSGCAASGFNTNQNAEHFMVHESREAFTDPYGTSWWDAAGYEADDKCAWSGLFRQTAADGHTYGYQPEYSNSARACVQ
ncbi:MAG: hypothetical protein ABI837_18525 [Acidobacteriota bacterium]